MNRFSITSTGSERAHRLAPKHDTYSPAKHTANAFQKLTKEMATVAGVRFPAEQLLISFAQTDSGDQSRVSKRGTSAGVSSTTWIFARKALWPSLFTENI
jgi:hypothetical protein